MDALLHMVFNLLLSFTIFKDWRRRLWVMFGGIACDGAWVFTVLGLQPIARFFHGFFGFSLVILFIYLFNVLTNAPKRNEAVLLIYAGYLLHIFVDSITHTYAVYPQYFLYPLETVFNIDKYWYFGLYNEATVVFLALSTFVAGFYLIALYVRDGLYKEKRVFVAQKIQETDTLLLISIIVCGVVAIACLTIFTYFPPYPPLF